MATHMSRSAWSRPMFTDDDVAHAWLGLLVVTLTALVPFVLIYWAVR